MEYKSNPLSHNEVQELAGYLKRFADRRSDDAGMAFSARNQEAYERALSDWKGAERLLALMSQ